MVLGLSKRMLAFLVGALILLMSPGVPDDVDLKCNRVATR
jgi:hypothetical protein